MRNRRESDEVRVDMRLKSLFLSDAKNSSGCQTLSTWCHYCRYEIGQAFSLGAKKQHGGTCQFQYSSRALRGWGSASLTTNVRSIPSLFYSKNHQNTNLITRNYSRAAAASWRKESSRVGVERFVLCGGRLPWCGTCNYWQAIVWYAPAFSSRSSFGLLCPGNARLQRSCPEESRCYRDGELTNPFLRNVDGGMSV
jgi:hypothetical protein